MESGASDQEMKRQVIAQEAARDTMFGAIEVNENSSEEEIGKFLDTYQNAVIANLKADADRMYKQKQFNDSEQARIEAEIVKWDGQPGGDAIIEELRKTHDRLSEESVELVGGNTNNLQGKVGEVNRQLDQAIGIRDAMRNNRKIFVDKYRPQIASLKATQPGAILESLTA